MIIGGITMNVAVVLENDVLVAKAGGVIGSFY